MGSAPRSRHPWRSHSLTQAPVARQRCGGGPRAEGVKEPHIKGDTVVLIKLGVLTGDLGFIGREIQLPFCEMNQRKVAMSSLSGSLLRSDVGFWLASSTARFGERRVFWRCSLHCPQERQEVQRRDQFCCANGWHE